MGWGRLPKFDEHEVYYIRKEHAEGETMEKLAKSYKVGKDTISRIINKKGVYADGRLSEVWDKYEYMRKTIKKYRKQGYSFNDIARILGVTKARASFVAKELGLSERRSKTS